MANAKAACRRVQPDVYNIPAVRFGLLTLGYTGNTERLSDVKWSKAASLCREMGITCVLHSSLGFYLCEDIIPSSPP